MKLATLAGDIGTPLGTAAETEIAGLTADSREVGAGFLFAALPGAKLDGARFVPEAVAKGAVAILCASDARLEPPTVPVLRSDDPRRALALMAARFHGRQPGTIVAVTGTNGKTSIAVFVRQIWAALGRQAASLGTIGLVTPAGEVASSHTTPEPVALHRMVASLANEGVTHLAVEASSHGLEQRRLDGLALAAGAFSNITRDHLDYHKTFEDYFAQKKRLFDTLLPDGAAGVVNMDGAGAAEVAWAVRRRPLRLLTVGRDGETIRLMGTRRDGLAQVLDLRADGRERRVRLPLVGDFQASNALVAAGLAVAAGEAMADVLPLLEHLEGAPGRLDLVGTARGGAPVFVDYAHTPDALLNVLDTLRPYAGRRLVVVLGCGGDRDKGKRPLMGRVAAERADLAIVTDDNPRSEEPAQIRREILAAAPAAREIGDRQEAIETAVNGLEAGDVLLVAGKGHEQGQIVGGRVLPFSDHAVVRAALERLAR